MISIAFNSESFRQLCHQRVLVLLDISYLRSLVTKNSRRNHSQSRPRRPVQPQ